MSSTYLTSENIETIERLLREVQPQAIVGAPPIVTVQARLLIAAFEAGMQKEGDLRYRLNEHIARANEVIN